ncbi:orotidine-5'-phosphate decarboxylase [Carboxydocella sporoproducens DSM 16521]|uniref:Orotidine 5'-phosphate decarboxylase n=2 Tax=Carboxydocella TaxID=178898 RepID=A0A1T4MXP8_9FIRM|nr:MULTISPECIES: orotidine-5'-phosphate decarboxylase [Carboxydocella]AVX20286.1 orotidine-5'-phosphate decarboxylase [Carboxydocella thermautotrophica]SJZ71626.1 orotidine-5'-phosphate decarboxylase [Carboxydocella sporoproducens DSM 16521]
MAVEKLILALDVDTLAEAQRLVSLTADYVGMYKVGMQLYYSCGPELLSWFRQNNLRVFLDLKLHDIPNTVEQASRVLASYGVEMFNVHAAGGPIMLKAALAGAQAGAVAGKRPLLLAVTVLTSFSQSEWEATLGQKEEIGQRVQAWARLARQCGLDGVVASSRELPLIQQACGPEFVTVIPGIRPLWAAAGDQQRIMTPAQALRAGAHYLVVGRPITGSADPREAARRVAEEMAEVLAEGGKMRC